MASVIVELLRFSGENEMGTFRWPAALVALFCIGEMTTTQAAIKN
jgi:hypothetical protein